MTDAATATKAPTRNPGSLKEVLTLAVGGASFGDLLNGLLQAARRLTGDETRASFYLLNQEGSFLRMVAFAGLDPDFTGAVARLPVGSGESSCGRAAHIGKPVLVEDVDRDPLLRPYLEIAHRHRIRCCWSYPLRIGNGDVIGTLAFYHTAPKLPDPALQEEIGYFCDLAALLMQRHLHEEESRRAYEAAQQQLAMLAEESNQRRRLYETVLSNTPNLVYVFDLQHRFAYANEVLLRMWGKTWDEAIGKTCLELGYEPWHAEMHDREIEQVKATGQPIRGEVPFAGTFGRRVYDYIFVPVLGPNGEVEAVAGTTRDITERKQFEEELLGSQQRASQAAREAGEEKQRLDALLEALPVGIGYIDANGRLFRVNAELRRLWGDIPATEDFGQYHQWRGWWADGAAHDGRLLEPMEWGLPRALRGEEVKGDLIEIERFDAARSRRSVLLRATPVRGQDGEIAGAVVAQMDITEQRRIEAALRDSEEHFRTITNAMPQMVWTALPDGHIDYHNQRFHDFIGQHEGGIEGTRWAERLLHPEDRQAAVAAWNHSVATGDPYEMTYRICHHSGEYRWILARALPLRDAAGTIRKWLGTDTDIHQSKLAEEALQEAHLRKDEFLAMLAHELRNPLAPISAAAEVLRVAAADPARVRQVSEIIDRQVRHMTALVNDLLDVSRVTRGLVDIEREEVDVKAVVAGAVEQVRPLIEARGHELVLRIGAAHARVLGDRTRLVQVIGNLLTNAAKYTPSGGRIALLVEAVDGKVRISVSDNGDGIDPALLLQVFDLFAQGERTPDRAQGGLGLGLALVKSIVALHGGEVRAHSDGQGRGSVFTIELQAMAAPSGRAEAALQDIAMPAAVPLRIMLVDDNADAAFTLASLLEAAGYGVTCADGPGAALESASAQDTDVFILDIGMPGMDGYELARRLQRNPRSADAVFIALTGYGQAHDRERALEAGFHHHFVKPVDFRQLAAVVGEFGKFRERVPTPVAGTPRGSA